MNGYWYGPYSYASYEPHVPVPQEQYEERMQTVLRLIQEAIENERHDELFYECLISAAPTEQEKQVITSIWDDECKHRSLFRQIYTQLTSKRVSISGQEEPFHKPASYLEGIENALMDELKAFEKYRVIYKYIPVQFRDAIFEIMTDEMKHASYYNWLYSKNK
ncbi:ferritin-like domain-containing protein [Brevibacillus reuszeri]|uniref:ferritin-like domain-containing protein n=1 Tax=Brevibacillus reuszeri TaxID=54915 RepID=UPI00289B8FC8|nr:ferritin-like domain-containing protein [Brevibacillus reuszeri]